jgi:hypothetical protein
VPVLDPVAVMLPDADTLAVSLPVPVTVADGDREPLAEWDADPLADAV